MTTTHEPFSATRKAAEEEEAVETYTCLHCGETDLGVSSMEPLQDGSPSNMCKECWASYKAARAAEIISLLDKWRKDKPKEEATAHSREIEKQLPQAEKKKIAAGKHSLRLVE